MLAIESIALVQAVDALKCYDKMSTASKGWYKDIRKIIPLFSQDQVMYPLMEELKQYLKH